MFLLIKFMERFVLYQRANITVLAWLDACSRQHPCDVSCWFYWLSFEASCILWKGFVRTLLFAILSFISNKTFTYKKKKIRCNTSFQIHNIMSIFSVKSPKCEIIMSCWFYKWQFIPAIVLQTSLTLNPQIQTQLSDIYIQ